MKKLFALSALASILLAQTSASSQQAGSPEKHLIKNQIFLSIATEFSGEAAQENTSKIVQYHRIQGSPMMSDVANKVVLPALRGLPGVESAVEKFPSDGKILYQTYISPMAWDMRGGELWIESVSGQTNFSPIRLCRYSDVAMCVSTYSKGGDWSGELVEVGSGTSESEYKDHNVRGKVALASGYAANVVRLAVIKHGAVGVVIYPDAQDRPNHPDMVRYNGIWPRAGELEKTSSGFQISANQYAQLKSLMSLGAVRVHGHIDATLGPGNLTLVHAYIRGSRHPEREVMVTAHLDHPKWSANDNASGSGTLMEMARSLSSLIAAKRLPQPEATIHFMWVPENFGTVAYITKHPEARRCGPPWDDPRQKESGKRQSEACIIANINMDMVGEDTVKTNSRFYMTRTPDSVPSFLNALVADALQQTKEANLYAPSGTRNYWPAEMIDYAQGSDHDVFLGLGVPSSMFGHDPDWTHHTSEDTLEKTDASEFRRVGTLANAVGWWMASGPDWERLHRAAALDSSARTKEKLAALAISSLPHNDEIRANVMAILTARAANDAQSPSPRTAAYPAYVGPHRLLLTPIYAATYENLSGEDKIWWDEQGSRFQSDSEGLPTQPPFPSIAFEAVNFMNGTRSTKEIANLLSAEYLLDIDQAWVDRLVSILVREELVAVGAGTEPSNK